MAFILALVLSQAVPQARLDVRFSGFLEIYFSRRAANAAAGPASPAEQLALASIDAAAIDCANPEEFVKACEALPESIQRGGQTIRIRETALALARQVAEMPAADRQRVVAEARGAQEAAKQAIVSAFGRFPLLLPSALESLGLSDVTARIPVVIVPAMPAPGAATYRAAGSGVVSVVGVGALTGLDLLETVLHEALHAADALAAPGTPVLAKLRTALTDAGVAPRTAADCVHAVIFAQAAATVRRVADPAHVPVGARAGGPYSRMSAPAREAVAIWTDRCDGKIDADTAIAKIVAAAKGTSARQAAGR